MNYDVRLPGHGGAVVFLRRTVVPAIPPRGGLDVGFLAPGRFVLYAGRAASPDLLDRLADFLFQAASLEYPDQSLPTLTDADLGLSMSIHSSNPSRVTLEVMIVEDPDADMIEHDGLEFDTSRVALTATAAALAGLIGRESLVEPDGRW